MVYNKISTTLFIPEGEHKEFKNNYFENVWGMIWPGIVLPKCFVYEGCKI